MLLSFNHLKLSLFLFIWDFNYYFITYNYYFYYNHHLKSTLNYYYYYLYLKSLLLLLFTALTNMKIVSKNKFQKSDNSSNKPYAFFATSLAIHSRCNVFNISCVDTAGKRIFVFFLFLSLLWTIFLLSLTHSHLLTLSHSLSLSLPFSLSFSLSFFLSLSPSPPSLYLSLQHKHFLLISIWN